MSSALSNLSVNSQHRAHWTPERIAAEATLKTCEWIIGLTVFGTFFGHAAQAAAWRRMATLYRLQTDTNPYAAGSAHESEAAAEEQDAWVRWNKRRGIP